MVTIWTVRCHSTGSPGGAHKSKNEFCTPGELSQAALPAILRSDFGCFARDSGSIPTQIGSMTYLNHLDTENNKLDGALPLYGLSGRCALIQELILHAWGTQPGRVT